MELGITKKKVSAVIETAWHQRSKRMTTYREALLKMLAHISVMGVEEKPLLGSMGQILAEDIRAGFDLPAFPVSGPDGYAVRSEDIKGASTERPAVLAITETVRAGHLPKGPVKRGAAVRIMTGSVVPQGADCVVPFEATDEPGDKNGPSRIKAREVKIYISPSPGANIQRAGSSAQEGSLVLPKGTVVGPSQVSALAALGLRRVKVIRRPVVGVIATGDEIVSPGKDLPPGKTYDCNTAAMAALVTHYGGIPRLLGTARDKEASLRARIERSMTLDALITTGGVSMGDFDLVRLLLGKVGEIVFSRIKMGPGAALAFGVIARSSDNGGASHLPVFALAGPPTGCLINFETLVRPALLRMLGFERLGHPAVRAIALDSVSVKKPIAFVKWTHLTKRGGEYLVELNLPERTGVLASRAVANSLTIIPEGTAVGAGDEIQVMPLDWCGYDIPL
jgi:molybdopterin molybdotransferase